MEEKPLNYHLQNIIFKADIISKDDICEEVFLDDKNKREDVFFSLRDVSESCSCIVNEFPEFGSSNLKLLSSLQKIGLSWHNVQNHGHKDRDYTAMWKMAQVDLKELVEDIKNIASNDLAESNLSL